jgi:hypothetical protein
MRQRNHIKSMAVFCHGEAAADHIGELFKFEELLDGQLADGQDQIRTENFHLRSEPITAGHDFRGIWHPVTALFGLARETARHGSHVNAFAKVCLAPSTRALKPAEERFSRRPGEGSPHHWLLRAGRLSHAHDL